MENLLFLFIVNIILEFSFQILCDSNTYCKNCSFCNYSDICSCNFYNSFCLNETSQIKYSKEFLINYDGCYSNDGEIKNICGESYIGLNSGEIKIFKLNSTNISNFICYYNIVTNEINDNNIIRISIQNNEKFISEYNVFLLIYDNNNQIKNDKNYLIMNNILEINETNCYRISIYLDFKNIQNFEDVSLIFENIKIIPDTYIINTKDTIEAIQAKFCCKNPQSNILLIFICIGGILILITIIVIIILHIKKRIKKNKPINNSSYGIEINNTNYLKIMKLNQEKIDNLFKIEFISKIYNNNIIKDCNKCKICEKDFLDNSSIIITTKCGHTFHENCFKNLIYKNIISPKCPICKNLILGSQNDNKIEKLSTPTLFEYIQNKTDFDKTTEIINN